MAAASWHILVPRVPHAWLVLTDVILTSANKKESLRGCEDLSLSFASVRVIHRTAGTISFTEQIVKYLRKNCICITDQLDLHPGDYYTRGMGTRLVYMLLVAAVAVRLFSAGPCCTTAVESCCAAHACESQGAQSMCSCTDEAIASVTAHDDQATESAAQLRSSSRILLSAPVSAALEKIYLLEHRFKTYCNWRC